MDEPPSTTLRRSSSGKKAKHAIDASTSTTTNSSSSPDLAHAPVSTPAIQVTSPTLAAEQLEKLKQFREAITKEGLGTQRTDKHLQRWLVAREWDLQKALDMYFASMKWREREGVDQILETYPKTSKYCDFLCKYWPNSVNNGARPRTRDGHQLLIECIGRVDPKIVDCIPVEELFRFHIWQMELGEKERYDIEKEVGDYVSSMAVIDLAGLGWHHLYGPALSLIGKQAKIDKDNYPESVRKLYVINPPILFTAVWGLFKLWFDEKTLAKLEVVSDPDVLGVLKRFMDEKTIMPCYGGTNPIDMPTAGPLDLANMTFASTSTASPKKQKKKVHVSRGAIHEERVKDVQAGSLITWEFKTIGFDINFQVLFESGEETKEVVPLERFDSHKTRVHGSLNATTHGNALLRWDNSYSWTRGKDLKYAIYLDATRVV